MRVRIDSTAYVPSWADRARQQDETLARTREIQQAFPPYRRERPRDPDEAQLLRRNGTPERLIGPSGPPSARSDEA